MNDEETSKNSPTSRKENNVTERIAELIQELDPNQSDWTPNDWRGADLENFRLIHEDDKIKLFVFSDPDRIVFDYSVIFDQATPNEVIRTAVLAAMIGKMLTNGR